MRCLHHNHEFKSKLKRPNIRSLVKRYSSNISIFCIKAVSWPHVKCTRERRVGAFILCSAHQLGKVAVMVAGHAGKGQFGD
jgi:hypothetical protein